MVTMDTIALIFTIVTVAVGATYAISRKLGAIEEKVDALERKVLEVRAELKADIADLKVDINRVEVSLKDDMKKLEADLKADIKRLDDRTYETSKLLGRVEAELASFAKKEGLGQVTP